MEESYLHNERDFVERLAAGDELAFYEFYNSYRPQLRSFALQMTKSATDADDVLQETFMRIWLSRDQIAGVNNLRSWVFTINARVCLTWLRTKVNQQKKLLGLDINDLDSSATPYDSVHINEMHRIIQQAVQNMSEQRRRVFRMSRDEGKNRAEIAQELGISPNTVRNILVEAIREIRETLVANGHVFTVSVTVFLFF